MHFAQIPYVPSCVLANQDILEMVLAVQVTVIAQNEWTSLAIQNNPNLLLITKLSIKSYLQLISFKTIKSKDYLHYSFRLKKRFTFD